MKVDSAGGPVMDFERAGKSLWVYKIPIQENSRENVHRFFLFRFRTLAGCQEIGFKRSRPRCAMINGWASKHGRGRF